MKLFPPQDEFEIYEQGFGTTDLLGRRDAGQRLSELLEKVEDSVVVAVDGPWGSGKSHFLKRWVGAHRLENGGVATTIYFDAFANDFLDDPLIALTGAIGERLPTGKDQDHWKTAKKVAYKLARPLLRLGAAAATAGATEFAGPVLDAVIEAGGKEAEKAAEDFWRREDGRKAAMHQFQDCLAQLTGPATPLIVVIDELDRCRPDYALSILEVIKHFFAVPRVHFVLGVNLDALEHIVRARYGVGVNAGDYLKRFISLSMQLPEWVGGANSVRAQIKYFETAASNMGIEQKFAGEVLRHLKLAAAPAAISLRDVEKILTRLVLLPKAKEMSSFYHGWQTVIISHVLFQVVKPELFQAAVRGSLTISDIDRFYGITAKMIDASERSSGGYDPVATVLHGIWAFALKGDEELTQEDDFSRSFDSFGLRSAASILPQIQRDHFGLFQIND
ncbi:AAA family ATPase [Rhizobium leguminosarum]|uniref:KAP family P-loop NTPase fold protein n=1 Tax=Rhizobium TaxID=379 RepID=UPI0014782181|nr:MULTISPECIES: P-loop NTPase fold protein [Rhizobium]MBY5356481.1 AAA family ATPase [Rhizobium leguminosarum]NNH44312.1 AAA family ATPase [Rhizobium laguerreae]